MRYTEAMRILISNDDGISAPGLAALVWAMHEFGTVHVVAPSSPQSAAGHSITLHQPLRVQHVRVEGERGVQGLAVDGRPADCVRLAIRNLLPERPDVVLSGINAGANVGVNVFYSGTVAAAAEAAMCGVPGVAFSAELASLADTETNYRAVAVYCRDVFRKLLAAGLQTRQLINVNVPNLAAGPPRGVRLCPHSSADVLDVYHEQNTPEGIREYRLGHEFSFHEPEEESDVTALGHRYVTVTPLRVNLTDRDGLASLQTLEFHRPGLQDDSPAQP